MRVFLAKLEHETGTGEMEERVCVVVAPSKKEALASLPPFDTPNSRDHWVVMEVPTDHGPRIICPYT